MDGILFGRDTPLGLTLAPTAGGFSLREGNEEVLTARCEGGQWTLLEPDGQVFCDLLPLDIGDATAVCVLEPGMTTRATVYSLDGQGRDVAMVRDGHGEPILVVRSDGPTGLHVVDMNGDVVAIAGSERKSDPVLEVLVLAGCSNNTAFGVVAALLSVQLERAGLLTA